MNSTPRRKTARIAALSLLASATMLLAQSPEHGEPPSQFDVTFSNGSITSLKRVGDSVDTDYLGGRRLGDFLIRFRPQGRAAWQTNLTSQLAQDEGAIFTTNVAGTAHTASYEIKTGNASALGVQLSFVVEERAVRWSVTLQNLTARSLEIGDLAAPIPIGARGRGAGGGGGGGDNTGQVIMKHSLISGNGSYMFWMRSSSIGPYLMMLPVENTRLEYWEAGGGFRVFIHSAVAGAVAKARGTKWRQPNTSLTLAPKGRRGDSRTYEFKFLWADDYDAVRNILVDEGKIDVQVVPGMTVPSDLFARFALRTKERIESVKAEFPRHTKIESLGSKDDHQLYQVRFSRLGENRLTINYGNNQQMFLEFFSTEPLETLIQKRGAFLARSQHRDPAKWYNGLITDWNMESQVLLSPDNYDRIRDFRIYAVTCDDPGLGKPAFLAAKNAEFPVQSEVEALDYYIKHFVWGGLQRTTEEKYAYGIYGIPDWKHNRESSDPGRNGQLHLWRVYDYPHIIVMYYSMYQIAKHHPQIKTYMTAKDYLQRAAGTALAMFTVPMEIERWSAYNTGLYNELVIPDLIREMQAAGMTAEADQLRGHWERKVKSFVNGQRNLFRSEYAFDSTGFESTHALAKYAMRHADPPGGTNSGIPLENAQRFLETQLTANLFCRGVLEPAYYYLGSDYRGGGGNAYTLTYMAQMGGWSVLDYALTFATNPAPHLRLGYQSYLSAWALMNTGTRKSNYGYWFPGKANDGGAGGGFEPAPYGTNWLQQPHHRGSWYYACEIDLGFCGALRMAATVLTDDPIFGRFCFGGDWNTAPDGSLEVVPKDGLRRRFHAVLGDAKLSLTLENDRFTASEPIVLQDDLSEVRFRVESDNPAKHTARLQLSGLKGPYLVSDDKDLSILLYPVDERLSLAQVVGNITAAEGTTVAVYSASDREAAVDLPVDAGGKSVVFTVSKVK